MLSYLKQIVNNQTKLYLILANILLAFFLILLSNLGILPLGKGDFIFFSFLFLAFALYRPGWTFLFFIGTIALENINIAPAELGLTVRPFQFFGALTILAIIVRFVFRRINFELPKMKWPDFLIIAIGISSFLSLIYSPDKISSFKFSVILVSFIFLYFLARTYIQSLDDLKRVAPFFFSSSMIVAFYGIWQNVHFLNGFQSFEVMPGRPNATFTEPDWLGIYLVFCIAVVYAIIYYCHSNQAQRVEESNSRSEKYTLHLLLATFYLILILTVSRSSWLGAFAVSFIFLLIVLTKLKFNPQSWDWKEFGKNLSGIIISILLSLGIIYVFHLTNFQLWNRTQSAGTGLQKITVACEKETTLPNSIQTIAELEKYDCRHINLEEINLEKSQGKDIYEIYRQDPNVSIRREIYKRSWEQIKNHPVLGIGWGIIGRIIGTDERGAVLNSSNIFLEVWLGSGIIGILSFIIIWIYILISGIGKLVQDGSEKKAIGIFLILGFFALIIPNLFNAGIFLGFLWIFLGVAVSLSKN